MVNLWNTFKLDFPEDSINKLQMTELVKRIFPRLYIHKGHAGFVSVTSIWLIVNNTISMFYVYCMIKLECSKVLELQTFERC